MRKNVYASENEPFEIEGCGVIGLNLNAILTAASAGTAVTKAGFDLDLINVGMDINVGNRKIPIYSGAAKPWAYPGAFASVEWSLIHTGSTNYAAEITKA